MKKKFNDVFNLEYGCRDNIGGIRRVFVDNQEFKVDIYTCSYHSNGEYAYLKCLLTRDRIKDQEMSSVEVKNIEIIDNNGDKYQLYSPKVFFESVSGTHYHDLSGAIVYFITRKFNKGEKQECEYIKNVFNPDEIKNILLMEKLNHIESTINNKNNAQVINQLERINTSIKDVKGGTTLADLILMIVDIVGLLTIGIVLWSYVILILPILLPCRLFLGKGNKVSKFLQKPIDFVLKNIEIDWTK